MNTEPALVCAPCWICLEDGPDEAGQPLIRECSCRGESSAGYHLSCIVKYAMVPVNKAIKGSRVHPAPPTARFERCPNCKQKYQASICVPLAEALIENTNHLSETNYVRYDAKMHLAQAYIFKVTPPNTMEEKEKEKLLALARNETKGLLKIVQRRTHELASSIRSDSDPHDDQEAFKAGQTAVLLRMLGQIKVGMGETERALILFEKALQNCEAAIAASWRLGDDLLETLQDNILTDIKQLKHDADVSSTSADREESLREELNALIDFGAAKTEIAAKKVELTRALLKKDPPDYVEAIRLSEEALDEFQRTLGPSHKLTRSFETVIEQGKDEYRRYLQNLRK